MKTKSKSSAPATPRKATWKDALRAWEERHGDAKTSNANRIASMQALAEHVRTRYYPPTTDESNCFTEFVRGYLTAAAKYAAQSAPKGKRK